jgi:hypothetical protein
VFEAINLRFQRIVQLTATVAMNVCPHGGYAVKIALPLTVNQPAPLPFDDNDLLITLPILHLSKGVPDMAFVPFAELIG